MKVFTSNKAVGFESFSQISLPIFSFNQMTVTSPLPLPLEKDDRFPEESVVSYEANSSATDSSRNRLPPPTCGPPGINGLLPLVGS